MPFPSYAVRLFPGILHDNVSLTLAESDELLEDLGENNSIITEISLVLTNHFRTKLEKAIANSLTLNTIEFLIAEEINFPDGELIKKIRDNNNIRHVKFNFFSLSYSSSLFKKWFQHLNYLVVAENINNVILEFIYLNLRELPTDGIETTKLLLDLLRRSKSLVRLIFTSLFVQGDNYFFDINSTLLEKQNKGLEVYFNTFNPFNDFNTSLLNPEQYSPLKVENTYLGLVVRDYLFAEQAHCSRTARIEYINKKVVDIFTKELQITSFEYYISPHNDPQDIKNLLKTVLRKSTLTTLKLTNITTNEMFQVVNETLLEKPNNLSQIELEIKIPYAAINTGLIAFLIRCNENFRDQDRKIFIYLDDERWITTFKTVWSNFVKTCQIRVVLFLGTCEATEILKTTVSNHFIKICGEGPWQPLYFYFDKGRFSSTTVKLLNISPGNSSNNNNEDSVSSRQDLLHKTFIKDELFFIHQQFEFLIAHQSEYRDEKLVPHIGLLLIKFLENKYCHKFEAQAFLIDLKKRLIISFIPMFNKQALQIISEFDQLDEEKNNKLIIYIRKNMCMDYGLIFTNLDIHEYLELKEEIRIFMDCERKLIRKLLDYEKEEQCKNELAHYFKDICSQYYGLRIKGLKSQTNDLEKMVMDMLDQHRQDAEIILTILKTDEALEFSKISETVMMLCAEKDTPVDVNNNVQKEEASLTVQKINEKETTQNVKASMQNSNHRENYAAFWPKFLEEDSNVYDYEEMRDIRSASGGEMCNVGGTSIITGQYP